MQKEMEAILVKGTNHTNVFVQRDKDYDDKDVVRISTHYLGGHNTTFFTPKQASDLINALQAALDYEQVV